MDLTAGHFPVDLVLFGMIAAFLVLRLRGILGKQVGLERRAAPGDVPRRPGAPVIEGRAEPPVQPERPLPDPSGPVGIKLARIRERDPAFDAQNFLRGAETAFRRIVQAFAVGDRSALRTSLTDSAFRAFDAAITAREAAGETQRAEIRQVLGASITDAALSERDGTWQASIDVRFVSDQVNVVLGRDGQPVTGTDATTEITDLWTFERALEPGGPSWRLADARHS